ncbi:MAG: 50S ribosomal protein L10 [Candidatus Nanoarchaeia archaeon]|nr:50S ribosomal protein L10 [Candidatus Nanoarchaeia archaeon]
MSKKPEPIIQQWKKDEVKDIIRLFNEYPVIGVINLQNLPALQFMKIRTSLKNIMKTKITKRRFIIKAIEQLKDKPHVEKLLPYLNGMPSLVFSKDNPFSLYKKISKNKSSAAAKAGQIAPNDLGVDAGPTPFAPGPIIGELGKLGLKTEVKEGKINLKEGKILVKTGQIITTEVSDLLAKFGVEPMEIGLNLVATYQSGEVLDKNVFGIDEKEYVDNIKKAFTWARNLAVFIEHPDPEILKLVVQKAQITAKGVAKKVNFETDVVVSNIEVSKQDAQVEKSTPQVKEEPKPQPQADIPKTEAKIVAEKPPEPEPKPEPRPPEPSPPEPEPKPQPPVSEPSLDDQVKIAQDVLKKIQDSKLTKTPGVNNLVTKKRVIPDQNKSVGDIINQLKDKKSRGEI